MEAKMEDGGHMAMPYHVHIIFSVPILGRVKDFHMHASNSGS